MAHYGYIRVSTSDQTTENQKLEILRAGFNIEAFFSDDGVSGTKSALERPAFVNMIAQMQDGDALVITKVDRLGRNAADILTTVSKLKERNISVKIIQFGGLDITSTAGKLVFQMLSAVAEMERDTLVERTKAGLERTKAQGTKLGAPLTIEPTTLENLCNEKDAGCTLDQLQEKYGLPRNTIHRNITKWKGNMEAYRQEWETRQTQYSKAA